VKIDFSRQGNFILTLLLIHFVFFGYIANVYGKAIGENILFLHLIMFNPRSFLSLIILILIIFILAVREHFFEYGIRNSIWVIPFMIVMTWIWYWFINGFDILLILRYFTRYESYISILTLVVINLASALLGSYVRIKYTAYVGKSKELKLITKW
jgi:hypothetical protein